MKKYRLTKITVKTREIISVSNKAASESGTDFCPVCNAPLSASFPAPQSSAGGIDEQPPPAELPAAEISDEKHK